MSKQGRVTFDFLQYLVIRTCEHLVTDQMSQVLIMFHSLTGRWTDGTHWHWTSPDINITAAEYHQVRHDLTMIITEGYYEGSLN